MVNWSTYVFNIDFLFIAIIVCVFLYFVFTSKRKTYDIDFSEMPVWEESSGSKNKSVVKSSKRKKKVNKSEEECRRIFQKIFKCKFKSVRPKWLANPATNKSLELDGFNPDIQTPIGKGLAFEYDGRQHSQYVPHFHKMGPDEFVYQTHKDSWKDAKCKELGITLIRIPHFVVFHDLERYIRQEISRLRIPILTSGRGLYD